MSSLRFLVDVNAGLAIATALRDAGHDVLFVGELDWRMPDVELLSQAHREQRIVLTMDTDFGGDGLRLRTAHAGILLLRMPGAGRLEKIQIVEEIIHRYSDQLPNRFCVYRQGKLRVRS